MKHTMGKIGRRWRWLEGGEYVRQGDEQHRGRSFHPAPYPGIRIKKYKRRHPWGRRFITEGNPNG